MTRRRRLAAGLLVVLIGVPAVTVWAVASSATGAAAAGRSGPPALVAPPAAGSSPILPGPLGGAASGIAGDLAQASAATVLDAVSHWVADGTAALLAALAGAINHETAPDLEAAWLHGHYAAMVEIAVLLALPLLFATAITAIVRQDAGPLVKAVLIQLPIAAIGTGVAIDVLNLALAATDGLCSIVIPGTRQDTVALFSGLSKPLISSIGTMGFASVLVCIMVLVGAFFLTLEMIVRSAAVYVAILFLPLALTGLVWPATARWGKRLAEMLAVLVLSKFVVVAIVSMAVAAISSGTGDGLSAVLTGGALLLIAAAAPFTLLRMVPIVEAGLIGHLEGAGRRAIAPPGVVRQQVEQQVISRLLQDRGTSPSPGPPSDGPIEDRAATSRSDRPLSADGTQGGSQKPVPAGGDSALPQGSGSASAVGGGQPAASAANTGGTGGVAGAAGGAAAAAGALGVAAVEAPRAVIHRVEASPSTVPDSVPADNEP
jgi:hypothetical protein